MQRNQTRWALYGLLLAPGAPLGLFLLLRMLPPDPVPWGPIYLYVGVTTVAVFSGFGFAAGRLMDRLMALSVKDPLTGLYTRRFFLPSLDTALASAERTNSPLAILMMDLDHFKRVNDEHGHHVGDQTLRSVAGVLKTQSRDADVLARYGGEEFVLMCPGTDENAARLLADRLRVAVAELGSDALGFRGHQTISIGVAVTDGAGPVSSQALLQRADEAMYEAKRAGRNRVV